MSIVRNISHDYVWMSQGPSVPPNWLMRVANRPDSFLVFGSFRTCDDVIHTRVAARFGKIHRICLNGADYMSGYYMLYKYTRMLEERRGQRFFYVILCDENGAFDFTDHCTPQHCGDVTTHPIADETAVGYFLRLLSLEQPAVASPILPVDAECEPAKMRVCATHLDAKLKALHWSAHPLLFPKVSAWRRISAYALNCVHHEIIESAFVGYTVQYRMFKRTLPDSIFLKARATYIRTMHMCFPEPSDTGFGDSPIVAWLRPQLKTCASANLGPSFLLQRGCDENGNGFDVCLPALPSPVNYSQLSCIPWASAEEACLDHQVSRQDVGGYLRPPRKSGIDFVQRHVLGTGYGWPHIPKLGESAADAFCRDGKDDFMNLVLNLKLRKATRNFSNFVLTENRLLCDALVLGALLVEQRRGWPFSNENAMDKIAEFVSGWSLSDLLGAGWLGLFEMLMLLSAHGLPRRARSFCIECSWLLHTVQRQAWKSLNVQRAPFDHWPCRVELAVRHLLDAINDTTWRSGHVVAAEGYIFNCHVRQVLAQPLMAYVWALFLRIGRLGVPSAPPRPPNRLGCHRRSYASNQKQTHTVRKQSDRRL